ncbi:MAG: c-type cytochrome biogenesis protein CcmI [Caulobacteraceae bacterium]|nr:c-type cytochrome biogenesis protein CcmI [Caulobacteraceae bacterium]
MIGFWIAAALLAASAAILMVRGGRAAALGADRDPAVSVYRRALAEIDDMAERDLIAPDERRATRAEAARRLLVAADRQVQPPTRRLGQSGLLAVAAAGPFLAVLIYGAMGSPDAPDQPFAGRLARWRASPELDRPAELAAALRSLASEHPGDAEPLRRLASLDLALGDADGAAHALRKAITIAPDRADLLAPLGELVVLKAQGVVGPEADALFRRALRGDAGSPTARYYLARARIARGDGAGGLALWRDLLGALATGDPRRPMLEADIAAVERTGHLADAAPPISSAAASEAIRGMVDGLAQRLETRPDDPAGWVRLVRAYAVLGESDKQAAAAARARRLYRGDPAVQRALAAAQRPAPS